MKRVVLMISLLALVGGASATVTQATLGADARLAGVARGVAPSDGLMWGHTVRIHHPSVPVRRVTGTDRSTNLDNPESSDEEHS